MAKFFDFILQGSEATEENAYSAARGLDWQEIEVTEANYPFLNYVDTVNGVGIWYNYGSDDYYFTDESEDLMENKKVVKITKNQLQRIINEGVKKLHKKTLIENRINKINEELSDISNGSMPYKSATNNELAQYIINLNNSLNANHSSEERKTIEQELEAVRNELSYRKSVSKNSEVASPTIMSILNRDRKSGV